MAEHGKPGHNSGGIAAEALKQFVERVQRLEYEKSALSEDLKQVYAEIKAVGLDTKIVRKMVALLKRERNEVIEEFEVMKVYAGPLDCEDIFG